MEFSSGLTLEWSLHGSNGSVLTARLAEVCSTSMDYETNHRVIQVDSISRFSVHERSRFNELEAVKSQV